MFLSANGTVDLYYSEFGSVCTVAMALDPCASDTEPPTITCPTDITVNNDPGECGAIVTYDLPTVTDNCPGAIGEVRMENVLQIGADGPTGGYYFVAPVDFTMTALQVQQQFIAQPIHQNIQVMRFTEPIPAIAQTGEYSELLFHTSSNTDLGLIPVNIPITAGDVIGILGNLGPTQQTTLSVDTEIIMIDGAPVNIFGLWTSSSSISTAPAPAQGGYYSIVSAPDNGLVNVNFDYIVSNTAQQTAGLTSGSFFPVGTTTNTFVAEDGAGNTATCSFDVIVNDTEAPTISCAYGSNTAESDVVVPPFSVGTFEVDPTRCGGGFGQTYVATNAGVLESIRMEVCTLNVAGDVVVELYDQLNGTLIATSDAQTITNVGPVQFDFPMLPSQVSGEDYWFRLFSPDSGPAEMNFCGATGYADGAVTTCSGSSPSILNPFEDIGFSTFILTNPGITVNNDPGECGAVVTYDLPTVTDNCPAPSCVEVQVVAQLPASLCDDFTATLTGPNGFSATLGVDLD
jgi:hypothetical protein